MFCWGLLGFLAGVLRKLGVFGPVGETEANAKGRRPRSIALCVYGFLSGFLYGWIMNLYYIIGWGTGPSAGGQPGPPTSRASFFEPEPRRLHGAGAVACGRALGQEAFENQEKIWADRRGKALHAAAFHESPGGRDPMSVIKTNNLQKHYQVGENSVHAVDGVDLNVREGRVCLHQRPERFRQVHTFKPAAGLESPTDGEVVLLGEHLEQMNERERGRFRPGAHWLYLPGL